MNQPDIKDIEIKIPKIGDKVICTYSRHDNEYLYVEFGYKSEGRINIDEFSDSEIKSFNKKTEIQAEFKDESFSFPLLSTLIIRRNNELNLLNKKFKDNEIVEGKFIAKSNENILVNLGKDIVIEGFIPKSEIDIEKFKKFYNKNEIIRCLIIDSNKYKLSLKKLDDQIEKQFFDSLELGKKIKGKVISSDEENLTLNFYGYELKINRKHVTLSNKKNLNSIFTKNSEYIFIVRAFSYENKNVDLEIEKFEDDVLKKLISSKDENKSLEGKVISIKDFGVFIQFNKIFDVFIPASECSWKKYNKDFFSINSTEIFKITNIDLKNGRISGSIKTTQPSPEENFFNLGNRSVEAIFSKEHKDNYFGKTHDGLNIIINKNDISWDKSKLSLNLHEKYICKILKLSNKKDLLKVSIKDIKENPWVLLKKKYKKNKLIEDVMVLEIDENDILIEKGENYKVIFPKKLVSDAGLQKCQATNKISGLVERYDERNNIIILNNYKYEKNLEKKDIDNFNKTQGKFEVKIGDIIRNKLKTS